MNRRTFLIAGAAAVALGVARAAQRVRIAMDPAATAAEHHACEELIHWLGRALDDAAIVSFEHGSHEPDGADIVLGTQRWIGNLGLPDFPVLGGEEVLIRTIGRRLFLVGASPRAVLYAVYRYLHSFAGIRWWTPWAATVPRMDGWKIPGIDLRCGPAFEYRDVDWRFTREANWAARNALNGFSPRLNERHGGKISYRGFVHTYYELVPPAQHFASHPEWFSLIDGRRVGEKAQLCTTNRALRQFIVERVRAWLREAPGTTLVSISQNDWEGPCQCEVCAAVDRAEGSHSGTVLSLVNDVAGCLAAEYPGVRFDTLAYQYSRRPPRRLRPAPNVVVRLCSIECDFREPLSHASNREFGQDLSRWAAITPNLHVWDYVTNFAHASLPHPNWFVLGANVRWFHRLGVRGVFAQGAHLSNGAEMAELRAWVLGRLLWDPDQDDGRLISEFLEGYYGGEPAVWIRRYLELIHDASRGYRLGCFNPARTSHYLSYRTLAIAEDLWSKARQAAGDDPDLQWRIRLGHAAIDYTALTNWNRLRTECRQMGGQWPLVQTVEEISQQWLDVVTGPGPAGWEPMQFADEWRRSPAEVAEFFVARAYSGSD